MSDKPKTPFTIIKPPKSGLGPAAEAIRKRLAKEDLKCQAKVVADGTEKVKTKGDAAAESHVHIHFGLEFDRPIDCTPPNMASLGEGILNTIKKCMGPDSGVPILLGINQAIRQWVEDTADALVDTLMDIYEEELPNLPEPWEPNDSDVMAVAEVLDEHPEAINFSFWRLYFRLVAASPYLMGKDKDSWQASWPWLVNLDNMAMVLEGAFLSEDKFREVVEAFEKS